MFFRKENKVMCRAKYHVFILIQKNIYVGLVVMGLLLPCRSTNCYPPEFPGIFTYNTLKFRLDDEFAINLLVYGAEDPSLWTNYVVWEWFGDR